MRHRDDYNDRSRGYRDDDRYSARDDRYRDRDRDMDRGAPEFSGSYICENCGSDEVSPRRGSGRDFGRNERDDYGHRDEFDRNSRMGIFDVPDEAYHRHDRDEREGRDSYRGSGGGGSRQGGYGDEWPGGERGRNSWGNDNTDNYRDRENRWTSSERPMTRQSREYYGSDHGFRDLDRYEDYTHGGRGGRNRR